MNSFIGIPLVISVHAQLDRALDSPRRQDLWPTCEVLSSWDYPLSMPRGWSSLCWGGKICPLLVALSLWWVLNSWRGKRTEQQHVDVFWPAASGSSCLSFPSWRTIPLIHEPTWFFFPLSCFSQGILLQQQSETNELRNNLSSWGLYFMIN